MKLLILILTIAYLGVITYAGVVDWKTRLVKPWTCIAGYIIALILAILQHATLKQIIIHSLWLALFFYIAAIIFTSITQKENEGVGGGDILIAPAVTLFMFNQGILPIYIGFALAFIDGFVFKRKKNNDETPMVTYFAIACTLSLFLKAYQIRIF